MGECELSQHAYAYGVKKDVFQGAKREYELDESNPFILRDLNKCFLCGKCVRACAEIQVNHVLDTPNGGLTHRLDRLFIFHMVIRSVFSVVLVWLFVRSGPN
jgi:formate dehydrogenase alpha subunit